MNRKSDQLRRQERKEILLTTLMDYDLTSKKLKACSPKTLTTMQSVLSRFIRFVQARGHSLKLADLTLQNARDFSASLNGKVIKYEGHKVNHPVPDSRYSPEPIHSFVRVLRTFSTWLSAVLGHVSKRPKLRVRVGLYGYRWEIRAREDFDLAVEINDAKEIGEVVVKSETAVRMALSPIVQCLRAAWAEEDEQ